MDNKADKGDKEDKEDKEKEKKGIKGKLSSYLANGRRCGDI